MTSCNFWSPRNGFYLVVRLMNYRHKIHDSLPYAVWPWHYLWTTPNPYSQSKNFFTNSTKGHKQHIFMYLFVSKTVVIHSCRLSSHRVNIWIKENNIETLRTVEFSLVVIHKWQFWHTPPLPPPSCAYLFSLALKILTFTIDEKLFFESSILSPFPFDKEQDSKNNSTILLTFFCIRTGRY